MDPPIMMHRPELKVWKIMSSLIKKGGVGRFLHLSSRAGRGDHDGADSA